MQKTLRISIGLGLAVMAMVSCGKKEEGKVSYQLSQSGCDTGKQEFTADTKEAAMAQLCSAIQEDKRNNYCAEGLRRDYFAKNCTGTYTPR